MKGGTVGSISCILPFTSLKEHHRHSLILNSSCLFSSVLANFYSTGEFHAELANPLTRESCPLKGIFSPGDITSLCPMVVLATPLFPRAQNHISLIHQQNNEGCFNILKVFNFYTQDVVFFPIPFAPSDAFEIHMLLFE